MKMRICNCYGRPTEVFTLTDEEKNFFNNSPNDFLRFVNEQLEQDRKISEAYQKYLDDEPFEEKQKKR